MTKRESGSIALSQLESEMMHIVWKREEVSAEEIRNALKQFRELKDSTVRTMLRRLEKKGALQHRVEGRTFIYYAPLTPHHIAVNAVKSIVHRFCHGSVSRLLLGMANDSLVTAKELRQLAEQIESSSNRIPSTPVLDEQPPAKANKKSSKTGLRKRS